ncbi:hypothetical protein [Nucisporomicrobium flavum]|uniref:hypothetical protein n=1 Tax=Nucisporomicrobium flavum TaxID=2785915 RepID=UPI0018F40C9D|nr:hypothetical protein [Nucisporomicrobium flavum]
MTTVMRAPMAPPAPRSPAAVNRWLHTQGINVERHLAALRPFVDGEFGRDAAAPTSGHLQAVNRLMAQLRDTLTRETDATIAEIDAVTRQPGTAGLHRVLRHKERAHTWVRAVERVWDFYFELFGQRQSRMADRLLSCDRIALDCYQTAFVNLGTARSIPAPAPFSYMRTGFSPATFRRDIPLRRLGRRLNPFPLIQLPYHRLVNPWTLGAILHEVSHNLQNDLGLAQTVPHALRRRLEAAGAPPAVTRVWLRWHRETFADLSALLLGGPAVVASLIDVVGRGVPTVLEYQAAGPHPTPYLRPGLSLELLRRMGFAAEADRYGELWQRLYPPGLPTDIPVPVLDTYAALMPVVVETMCFTPYPSLGDRALASVLRFARKDQAMVCEAAERLAAGTDPGVVPERYLIGAARSALDRRLAPPDRITDAFYRELARR